uniref:tigger transposable element-derived protein 2-like isoform X2 n=1 Tax=Osmia lignaria TaxID=473952 RepID=UPI001478DDEA|nr:tigger transposable element-derived protein 2-like isoform X2 [Osmia lignaria]
MELDNKSRVCEPERKKRKNVSILEKLKILEELDVVKSMKVIAEKYGIPERTLRGWKKNRYKLEEINSTYILTNNSKRIRVTALDQLEEALYIWYNCMTERGITLTGPLVIRKALELHKDMGIEKKFVASEGWLSHWKSKYGMRQHAACGERFSPDSLEAPILKEEFESIMRENELTLCQIFKTDKTSLNVKMMPKKLHFKPTDFKQNKERFTVMICTNGDGTLKLPLLAIGNSTKSKALENLSPTLLPIHYAQQTNPLITIEIFEDWFRNEFVPRVTTFLKEKGLPAKALLLLDYAPCYASFNTFYEGDIKVTFLQPMDWDIIETFKRHYKLLFLHSILFAQKNGINLTTQLKSITIKDIIYWMSDAWDAVNDTTILKCWKKLLPNHYYENTNENLDESIMNEEILNNVRKINEYQDIDEESVQNWINPKDEDTNEESAIPTNSELIAMVAVDYKEDTDDNDAPPENNHPNNVVSAADTLLSFYEENGLLSASDLAVIRKAKQLAIKIAISE